MPEQTDNNRSTTITIESVDIDEFSSFLKLISIDVKLNPTALHYLDLKLKNIELSNEDFHKLVTEKEGSEHITSDNLRKYIRNAIKKLSKFPEIEEKMRNIEREQPRKPHVSNPRMFKSAIDEIYMEKYSSTSKIWKRIWNMGSSTNKMYPVFSDEMDMIQPSISVPANSYIRFEVNLEIEGYLLLLEKGTSEEIWCLCPSPFGTETFLTREGMIMPQPKNPIMKNNFFVDDKGLETVDRKLEKILAIVTEKPIRLQWIENLENRTEPVERRELLQLLELVRRDESRQIFHTTYEVYKQR